MVDAVLPTENEFDLFQEDILKKLSQDVNFFQGCIAFNFFNGAKKFWCDISLSKHKLREAWEFWVADLDRLLEHDSDHKTKELDEFKQCAFLTFWIRRHQPIKSIHAHNIPSGNFADVRQNLQRWYSKYGDDFGAIEVGSTICLNYCGSSIKMSETTTKGDPRRVQFQSRKNYLSTFRRRKDFWADFAMIMKHKNNSPHSITLIYEALFGMSLPPIRKRKLQSGQI